VERLDHDDAVLEYEVHGAGDAILLIHLNLTADGLAGPLLRDGTLESSYLIIHYHRRGYRGSTTGTPPVSIPDQAADAAALLSHLGIHRAHIVGHSYGGVIGIQLARDRPDLVHSLALLEPALQMVPSGRAHLERNVFPAVEMYRAGDRRGAVATFVGGVFGPGWEALVEEVVPGGVEQAAADADMFFAMEVPAIREWSLEPLEAATITQPILSVVGVESAEIFFDGRQQLHLWFRDVEDVDLPDANHLLQMRNPRGLAEALIAFFVRHPISDT